MRVRGPKSRAHSVSPLRANARRALANLVEKIGAMPGRPRSTSACGSKAQRGHSLAVRSRRGALTLA